MDDERWRIALRKTYADMKKARDEKEYRERKTVSDTRVCAGCHKRLELFVMIAKDYYSPNGKWAQKKWYCPDCAVRQGKTAALKRSGIRGWG